jgi:hypothetical protein
LNPSVAILRHSIEIGAHRFERGTLGFHVHCLLAAMVRLQGRP